MNANLVAWAKQHDWFHSAEECSGGSYKVWVLENGQIHPWPFINYSELRAWAGY